MARVRIAEGHDFEILAKVILEEFPQVEKKWWSSHLWSAGYYIASVGDKFTTEMVKKYIRHERQTSFDW
jgi:REP element-mobilizing transposase RayT